MKPFLILWSLSCALAVSGCGGDKEYTANPAKNAEPAAREKAQSARIEGLSREVERLRERVVQLEQMVRKGKAAEEEEATRSGVTAGAKTAQSPKLPKLPARAPAVEPSPETPPPTEAPAIPVRGQPISQIQRESLMRDEIPFRPGSIVSSGLPVLEDTVLQEGQDLQLKWGSSWWAATITGFEPDGGIRVRYFGWGSYPEEIVPRSDLQLDSDVRRKAVDATYPP